MACWWLRTLAFKGKSVFAPFVISHFRFVCCVGYAGFDHKAGFDAVFGLGFDRVNVPDVND